MEVSLRAIPALLLAAAAAFPASGQKQTDSYAIVAGTVFRDPGYALPDAKVVLSAAGAPKAKKLQEAVTNYRGEFLFRVPAREGKYVIKAAMKGFKPESKETSVSGSERVDVNLVLLPEAK